MDKDVPYALEDGDTFTLLTDQCPYTVHVEKTVIKKSVPKPKPAPKEKKPKEPKEPKAPKSPKAASAKSVSTSAPAKKKGKNIDPEEIESDGPDEYDLSDSFIDTREDKQVLGGEGDSDSEHDWQPKKFTEEPDDDDDDENLDETIKEGRSFVKSFKRKYPIRYIIHLIILSDMEKRKTSLNRR
jgi:hypothetical protein